MGLATLNEFKFYLLTCTVLGGHRSLHSALKHHLNFRSECLFLVICLQLFIPLIGVNNKLILDSIE